MDTRIFSNSKVWLDSFTELCWNMSSYFLYLSKQNISWKSPKIIINLTGSFLRNLRTGAMYCSVKKYITLLLFLNLSLRTLPVILHRQRIKILCQLLEKCFYLFLSFPIDLVPKSTWMPFLTGGIPFCEAAVLIGAVRAYRIPSQNYALKLRLL